MIQTICLNGHTVSYDLKRKPVKNMNLRISAQHGISLSVPERASKELIEAFLQKNATFILRALDRFGAFPHPPTSYLQYNEGEQIYYLGQPLTLSVQQGSKNKAEVTGLFLTLTVRNPSDFLLKKKTVDQWLKKCCQEVLPPICKSMVSFLQPYGVPLPALRYRTMVSRWGSCHPTKQVVTFSSFLIQAPLPCIEYVVLHELTHFLYPNHSKRFYAQLSAFMPDWKERKARLEQTPIPLSR